MRCPAKFTLKKLFFFRLVPFFKGLVFDVFLQRRLFRHGKMRWAFHGLIFYPFVFRFSWGLAALVGSLCRPDCALIWKMVDKNHAATAFFFDLSGMMVLLGIGSAFFRCRGIRSGQLSGLPRQDYAALALITAIFVIGFILEGMRMAMTGWPGDASYAFIGYWISKLFTDAGGLTEIYGYVWYLHAVVTGAFFVYLPFSRLLHIIVGPVVLLMNAVTEGAPNQKRSF